MEKIKRYTALANSYTDMGGVYYTRGELNKAVEYHEKALGINNVLDRKEAIAITYANLGLVYDALGKSDVALEYWEKSLAMEQVLGRKMGIAYAYGNLGILYETQKKVDKAIEYWKKALAIFTEIDAQSHMMKVQGWLDEALGAESLQVSKWAEIGKQY